MTAKILLPELKEKRKNTNFYCTRYKAVTTDNMTAKILLPELKEKKKNTNIWIQNF